MEENQYSSSPTSNSRPELGPTTCLGPARVGSRRAVLAELAMARYSERAPWLKREGEVLQADEVLPVEAVHDTIETKRMRKSFGWCSWTVKSSSLSWKLSIGMRHLVDSGSRAVAGHFLFEKTQ